jgi:hypothetical protein
MEAMEDVWGTDVWLHAFLTKVNGRLHAPATLPPGKEGPPPTWTGGSVGTRIDMGKLEKRHISPLPGIKPKLPWL